MRRKDRSEVREQYHAHFNQEILETIDLALDNFPFLKNTQGVIDYAFTLLNRTLTGRLDEYKEELSTEYKIRAEGLDVLKAGGGGIIKSLAEQVVKAPTAVADSRPQQLPIAVLFAGDELDEMRGKLLNKCHELTASGAMDWCKNWKVELAEVGLTPSDFVTTYMEFRKRAEAQTPQHTAPTHDAPKQTPIQYRIEALVTRLYRIASPKGADYVHFDKDFEDIQNMKRDGVINNGQLEMFKDTVIKKFKAKVQVDVVTKRMKQENVDVTLTLFEDQWFKEFEAERDGDSLSEEEQRLLGVG